MINKIRDKNIYWENEPLNYAIKYKKLFAFKHKGFWKSLDTLKDKNDFNEMFKKKYSMDKLKKLQNFWKNKNVFITGHTEFKGTWFIIFLNLLGANVYGYSLKAKKIALQYN